jgi:hypothetical protein
MSRAARTHSTRARMNPPPTFLGRWFRAVITIALGSCRKKELLGRLGGGGGSLLVATDLLGLLGLGGGSLLLGSRDGRGAGEGNLRGGTQSGGSAGGSEGVHGR